MIELRDHKEVSIYTDTLFMLARDAWTAGRQEAFEFIKGYLAGLVSNDALDAFLSNCQPLTLAAPTQPASPQPPPNGGAPVIPAPIPPTRPPAGFQVRQSATLAW